MKPEELLAEGLRENFKGKDGKAKFHRRFKHGLMQVGVEYRNKEGTYSDIYFEASMTQGQEIASTTDEGTVIRAYAGGLASKDTLAELEITDTDILEFLRKVILEHSSETRLYKAFEYKENDFRYLYLPMVSGKESSFSEGIETIYYNGEEVFIHKFIITLIEP